MVCPQEVFTTCPILNSVYQNPSIVFLHVEFPLVGISEGATHPPNLTLLIVAFVQALTINDLQHVYNYTQLKMAKRKRYVVRHEYNYIPLSRL